MYANLLVCIQNRNVDNRVINYTFLLKNSRINKIKMLGLNKRTAYIINRKLKIANLSPMSQQSPTWPRMCEYICMYLFIAKIC